MLPMYYFTCGTIFTSGARARVTELPVCATAILLYCRYKELNTLGRKSRAPLLIDTSVYTTRFVLRGICCSSRTSTARMNDKFYKQYQVAVY